ncbi:toxin-antitoxin system YwqK family antitoxin [Croceimicrobium sp.]|uniref:toxin-antitoxin system YwqK family antitoxin n=1 Tax=Croceimicrobium sp. TaxID=2828340 RepID=UPI003BAB3B6D|tara:strand:+ start:1356 stop:1718 length:363 start_codon:yes stop_codon:yes gene_type:complete
MKKLIGILVIGFMMAATAYAQSPTYERVGKQVKVTKYFDGTDIVKEVGFFKDGKSHGQWTEYTRDGQVRIEATYVDGKKEGVWFVWSEDRNTLYEVNYLDNRVSNIRSWSVDERNLHVER